MKSPFHKARLIFIISIIMIAVIDHYFTINILIYVIPLALFGIFILAGSSILSLNIYTKSYTQSSTSDNKIALTFDDGPSLATLEVLNILRKHNVKATFFCIGNKIKKHPEIIEKIVSEGHIIGNHSYSHNYWFPLLRVKAIVTEIERTNTLIEKFTKQQNNLFRPPFGVMNPNIAKAGSKTNQRVIGWNLRSFDTTTKDKNKVIQRIQSKLHPGSVILLHDDRSNTPDILDSILQYAQKNKYTIVDVPHIFNLTNK